MFCDFMVFTARPVEELPSFGEKLKKAREEAGLTKEKVAQLLNLPIKYLNYFEAGEIEKLPVGVYAKGFLRKYAKLLEVDEVIFISEYEKETRIIEHLKGRAHQSLPTLPSHKLVITPKTLGWIAGLIIIFLVAGYFFYQIHFLLSPPDLIIFEPADSDFAVSNSLILFKGKTEPGVKLTINGQPAYIDKDGNFQQEINLAQGLNIIKVEAVNRFGKSRAETKRIVFR